MMPGMSGLDVVTEIRALFSSIAVPVLMISAKSGDVYVEQGLRMGCNDYITKPFSARELVARIQAQVWLCFLLRVVLFSRAVVGVVCCFERARRCSVACSPRATSAFR